MSQDISVSSAEELKRRRARVEDGGRPESIRRQHDLGKLSARERVDTLVDDGTFRELGMLAEPEEGSLGPDEIFAPRDGVIIGLGRIDGRRAAIMSFDFTVFGGTFGTTGALKMTRCMELARRYGVPMIMIFDGGGGRIQGALESRHFAAGFEQFQYAVDLSGYVPLVTVVLGQGFGGPSNFASLADLVVMVRGMSTLGIAGPPLVRGATGEKLTNDELGGADLQASLGLSDIVVDTEAEAFDAVRVFLGYLPSNSGEPPFVTDDEGASSTAAEIRTMVPPDSRQSYDVRGVIDALVDSNTAFELRPSHAPNIVTSFARLGGRPVGVIANQPLHLGGALDSWACEKAAHFISMCDAFGVALLFLVDIPGFLVGMESVTTQLVRRSGRIIFELGEATVPRMSVVLRKGYGTGYIAMCGGRSFSADLALAWPTAEICTMAVEGAVDIAYRREIRAAQDPAARRAELIAGFRSRVDPFLAAQGFGLDDVVDPAETRELLVDALREAPCRRPPRAPYKRRGVSPI